MKIWMVDPRLTAERRLWIEGWARHSPHQILAFTLPSSLQTPAGGASSLARERARRLARRIRRYLTGSAVRDPSRQPAGLPDLVLLTDGLDGEAFVEEIGDLLAGIPLWIYWHTSGMADPETATPEEIAVELRTVRAAERCLFHGERQREHFLRALSRHEPALALQVEKRAAVIPPGFDPLPSRSEAPSFREPLVLWLLRGEPGEIPMLIAALDRPALQPLNFHVLLLSERPEMEMPRVQRLPPRLRARILGILSPESPEAQGGASAARAIVDGSIRPHSPIHLMRLTFEGPWPLVPASSGLLDALPAAFWPLCAYHSPEDLAERLRIFLTDPPSGSREIRQALAAWMWPVLAPRYDALCETARSDLPGREGT
ncbi:hypothetical protein [Thermoflexus sp.]|mgnify:CR=1 FL=1|uniref:hypothetical protein n=1 Tax=Thermoflexus sp. TaxID=1969742 RepID=UPI001763F89F|nr:hypothetical protein [Thermoflexus sp.]